MEKFVGAFTQSLDSGAIVEKGTRLINADSEGQT